MKSINSLLIVFSILALFVNSAAARATAPDRYSEFEKDGIVYSKFSAAYPTGYLETSTIRLDKIVPKQVMLDQEYTYQTIVTNLQQNKVTNVIVTDKLSANFELVRSTPQAKIAGGVAEWIIPEIGPSQRVVISSVGKSTDIGSISSCGAVSWDEYLCATTEVVNPGLEAKVTAPATASLCNIIPLVYTATNTGSSTLTNVIIDGGDTSELLALDGTRGGRMRIGTLAPGESKQIKVNAKAESTGNFDTIIRAVSDQITSKEDAAVTMVTAPVLNVDVSSPSSVIQGRTAKYTIRVSNTGSGPAESVVIKSPLPQGTELVSASSGGRLVSGVITWPAVKIGNNQKAEVSVSVRPVSAASIRATATAEDECAKAASGSAVTSIQGVAAILLEVVDDPDPIEVGGTTTYTIVVTNQGSATDTNVQLKCMIEDTQKYVSSSGATNGTHSGGTVTFRPLAQLGAKQRATWKVVVSGAKESDTRFKVSMTSDQLTRPVEETEATKIY